MKHYVFFVVFVLTVWILCDGRTHENALQRKLIHVISGKRRKKQKNYKNKFSFTMLQISCIYFYLFLEVSFRSIPKEMLGYDSDCILLIGLIILWRFVFLLQTVHCNFFFLHRNCVCTPTLLKYLKILKRATWSRWIPSCI